jgi:hypothetical protein
VVRPQDDEQAVRALEDGADAQIEQPPVQRRRIDPPARGEGLDRKQTAAGGETGLRQATAEPADVARQAEPERVAVRGVEAQRPGGGAHRGDRRRTAVDPGFALALEAGDQRPARGEQGDRHPEALGQRADEHDVGPGDPGAA